MFKRVVAFSLLLAAGLPARAELVYDTTHFSSLGAEITPLADGPASSLADLIVLGGAARLLTELRVDLYVLHSAEPFDLTLRLYSDRTSSGGGGACGSGPGLLIPGSTLTRTITPPGLNTHFSVSFDLGRLDLAGDADGTVAVALNSSRCDVYWVINEVPVLGAHPAGEPAASVVERCGSSNANGALDFGLSNDFGLRLAAEAPLPPDIPPTLPSPELNATMTAAGVPAGFPAGGLVTYTVILRNPTEVEQPDNPANEFKDVLPAQLTLLSASAPAGTVTTDLGTGRVTWNGVVPAMGAVILTIEATIDLGTEGQIVANQGTVRGGAAGEETLSLTDDPTTPAAADATVFPVAPLPQLLGTKTVAGTPGNFPVGGRVTYTVILRNPTAVEQPDNPVDEFQDVLPGQLTLLSATASEGTVATDLGTGLVTWNGVVSALGAVTLTIEAFIDPGTEGQIVANQGTIRSGATGHETLGLTDDPTDPATASDITTFVVLVPEALAAELTAAKSVAAVGPFQAGGFVTYTIVISNSGNAAQADNAGHELVDVLPASLELLGASSPGGNVGFDPATQTVTWDGRLEPAQTVTIEVEARIYDGDDLPRAPGCGQTITNQGTLCFDSDNGSSNDLCLGTDDPSLSGAADPTSFTVSCGPFPEVPALSPAGLLTLALLLAGAMWRRIR